jgi:hypothetical protein
MRRSTAHSRHSRARPERVAWRNAHRRHKLDGFYGEKV